MKSIEQMQLAWRTLAENRITAAQDEGLFDELAGMGRPLEEIMDISDPHGWVRRAIRDCDAMKRSGGAPRRIISGRPQSCGNLTDRAGE